MAQYDTDTALIEPHSISLYVLSAQGTRKKTIVKGESLCRISTVLYSGGI